MSKIKDKSSFSGPMGKRHGMMQLNDKKAKNFKGTFKRLLFYLNIQLFL